MSAKPANARLDRLLANMGYGSRREINNFVRNRRVLLDGAELEDSEQRIVLSPDLAVRMLVDGAPLDPLPGFAIMLHKPVGVTCSHKEAGRLVYDLLPERWRRREPALATIGRLDKETSGLLLMTDDGALLHRIISPKNHISKRYQVMLAQDLRGDEEMKLAAGTLMLEGEEKPLLPVAMVATAPRSATVVLTEGRYHQARRMFAALGNHVTALHRDRVGGLDLPEDLAAGEFRIMKADDLTTVFA